MLTLNNKVIFFDISPTALTRQSGELTDVKPISKYKVSSDKSFMILGMDEGAFSDSIW